MNNYERIKQMNIDEMAEFLVNYELNLLLKKELLRYKKIKQWLNKECEK